MIRFLLKWPIGKLLQIAEVTLKETFSGSEIRSFLEESLSSHLHVRDEWQSNPNMSRSVCDVDRALVIGQSLGLSARPLSEGVPQEQFATCGVFHKLLARGKVIDGAAESLEAAVVRCELSTEFCGEMNRVLRHIEIKRKECLPLSDSVSIEQWDLVRAQVCVALLVYSKRKNDLRFLNTAMKLNDWLLVRLRKSAPSKATAKLLYAIMLQEAALSGLGKCES